MFPFDSIYTLVIPTVAKRSGGIRIFFAMHESVLLGKL
jgi:hypothetical protein